MRAFRTAAALLFIAAAVHQLQAGQRGAKPAPAKPPAAPQFFTTTADARRDAKQAGRRRDRSRDDRHRPACRKPRPITSATSSRTHRTARTPGRRSIASCVRASCRAAIRSDEGSVESRCIWHRRIRGASGRAECREEHARRGIGCRRWWKSRQRRHAVLHLRRRSAWPRRCL